MNSIAGHSSIFFAFLKVVGGIAMLAGGGEILVRGATSMARWRGMSTLIIGLTVVAFGTSIPELFVSLTASLKDHPDIMLGNVIGSNTANIGLILGLSALLAPLKMVYRTVRLELALVLIGSLFLIGATIYGSFPRILGLIFVSILVYYTIYSYKNPAHIENYDDESCDKGRKLSPGIIYFLIICGLVLLVEGSDIFINGAVDIARFFGVSELIIGLTLAAIGTSLPELASCLVALRHGESNLLIGNIIGSNMFNLFMVLGLTSLIKPFPLPSNLLFRDLPVMLVFSLALMLFLYLYNGTKRYHGFIFLSFYCLYCFFLL